MALDRPDTVNCRIKKPPALQRQKTCATSFPIRRAGQREHTRGDDYGRGPGTIANNRFPLWVNSKHPEVALRAPSTQKPLSINTKKKSTHSHFCIERSIEGKRRPEPQAIKSALH